MKVTCLCLTRNRREWLPKAIECYQLQTYANRELLIVADGEDIEDLIPDDPSIRLLRCPERATVGQKRDLGCGVIVSELIAIWDDDDWSAPGRLADQVARSQETGKAVMGYRTMRFTDGSKWWLYQGDAHFALATSLCFRREYWAAHHFGSAQVGQDERFAWDAWHAGQLAVAEDETMMYATIHAGNTSPRKVDGGNWKKIA